MAKKKKINNNISFNKILGFDFIQNEKVIFVFSIILLAVAIFFVASFVSFLTSGNIDQSMIESPREGEIMI